MTAEEKAGDDLVVTGGSSGIGLALVEQLTGEGHRVTCIARRPCPVPGAGSIRCDLADAEAIERCLPALSGLPVPRGVIFCHGQGDFGALEQFSAGRIRRLVDLHVVATLLLCRHFLPSMKRLGRGTLVFLGSEAALRGASRGAVYCATKFALRGAAQALREECGASGVRVGIVNPGMVDTPFYDAQDFAPGDHADNHLDAADVVDAILLMLGAPAGSVIDEINLSPLKKVIRRT